MTVRRRQKPVCRWRWILACVLAIAGGDATPLQAQVFQVQGGGSSLFEGYGGLVNVWGNGYEASIGAGYLDGLRIGASARRLVGRDTLRLGNDLLPFSLDTDIFGNGSAVFAQGASLQQRRGRTQIWAFAGASASALSAPMFASQRATRAMAYVRTRYDVTRKLALTVHAVATDRQSLLASASWEPALGTVASATAGVGSNSPYGSLAVERASPQLDLKASLTGIGSRFRRASAPMPMQSEVEHENVLVTWKPRAGFSLGAGRQHFRQDSVYEGLAQRATLNQITGSASVAGTSVTGGWLISESGSTPNVSSYLSLKDNVFGWLESEFYLLNVWKPEPSRNATPVLLLRETVSSRLSLLQVMTHDQGRTSVSFGGTVAAGLSSFSLDYQVVHSPYLTADPFLQTMGVNARVHLLGMTLSLGSLVTPDGRVHYSGQGSTFLYRGTSTAGPVAAPGRPFDRFIIEGRVVDEAGAPVEGAAISIGGEILFTNSQGHFFQRRRTAKPLTLEVLPDEFLLPGTFEVVDAPTMVAPVSEGSGKSLTIVLRRVRPAKDIQGFPVGGSLPQP